MLIVLQSKLAEEGRAYLASKTAHGLEYARYIVRSGQRQIAFIKFTVHTILTICGVLKFHRYLF
ncbi:hypothetical protein BCU86_22810 [Vibrio lentus]|nr:hypothetical protein BCU86_22810 [Vibrio lentus]PMH91307.1 hypothetical protein BCU56_02110 [Vibrio lentus]PMJ03582.1 hypothetical protein BCU32_21630 [Vibrio lentus]PMJ21260.1 hypothetical protein BCU29_22465 [Vibrio lentus]